MWVKHNNNIVKVVCQNYIINDSILYRIEHYLTKHIRKYIQNRRRSAKGHGGSPDEPSEEARSKRNCEIEDA